jgi:sodium/pantothenate symporter
MMFGGANSMVYTNTIQALIMIVVALMMIFSGVNLFDQGLDGFIAKLNVIDPNLTTTFNTTSPLYRDFFEVVVCQAIVGIAIVCQPHIMTKSLMLKNPEKVNSYLFFAISAMIIFFLIVIAGLYARMMFPDLMHNGTKMRMDEIIPVYVVKRFSAAVGIVVIVGLISAGLSTLEGLIQSLSITVTSDILEPIFGEKVSENGLVINKFVVVLLAIVSFYFSWNQIKHPNLSVAIFGQMGVYGYFAPAFVPVLFGTIVKNVKSSTVFIASIVAILIHFGIFYLKLTPYMKGPVGNPGVSAAIAIVSSVIIAVFLHTLNKNKSNELL